MRNFKELLTGQGEDLFHKNMRKFGATVLESHQAFKDIKEGNIEGGGGSASTMEYWDVTAMPAAAFELGGYALLVKFRYNSNIYVRSSIELIDKLIENYETSLFAVALDKNIKMMENGSVATVGEIFESKGFPDFASIGWKQITEEEFYNLDNGGGNSMIEFTINGTTYQAEEGMTWGEFAESSYNNGNVIYDVQYYSISYNGNPIFNNGRGVKPDAVIISGTDYTSEEVG